MALHVSCSSLAWAIGTWWGMLGFWKVLPHLQCAWWSIVQFSRFKLIIWHAESNSKQCSQESGWNWWNYHICVELEFIAHFCAFIRSSIALSKSMPFTWCVLSLPYGPSYCTHPVVFFPIFFPFFSSQKCFALWGNWTSHLLLSFVDFRLCGLCHCTVASPYVTPHCRQSVASSSKSPDFIELDLGV